MSDEDKRKLKLQDEDSFFGSEGIVSSMDCTGLIQTPPANEEEADAYTDIYDIPKPVNEVPNGLQHE
ncbi:hypothetical protein [Caproiciproducens galactitolivorans]|uniref:DUF4316 domain-containing protein n=1 Tax=Caproiciproducens galactitolivorans TaxID=642589 RepID=A0ABT4BUE6_9FIRM|nr:hypothetical protein [Caproiciproducens galactitolivorans]MCY1713546.1 hypothetical protein [Caproiciproducens galactitolivorans]